MANVGLLALAPACGTGAPSGGAKASPASTVEHRAPEATNQAPAVSGQTRAPLATANVAFDVVTIATSLEHPWGLAFLPDDTMLVTERPGRMRIVSRTGALSAPIAGLPEVHARGQGGLLDVARDPQHATNRRVYWSYAEPREGGNGTAVARGTLNTSPDGTARMDDVAVIWRQTPTLDSVLHFGSRLVWAKDGTLFITTGDRGIDEGRVQAQHMNSALGKVIRINPDGTIPKDNPFVGQADVLPEIWSSGHRNVQAAEIDPATGKLWVVDHGARGGDELNQPEAGKNYGWPVITYGIEYSGQPIGEGRTQQDGMEQPTYYWDPVIAPSGMAFYEGDMFPAWQGSLFVGALAGQHLARLTLRDARVVGEERLLTDLKARIRDVRVGPDGAIYVLTDAKDGKLLKLVAKPAK